MTEKFQSRKRVLNCKQILFDSPDKVFPLLCPTKEYDWISFWSCDLISSDSGYAELDCVFITDFKKNGKETWIVDKYEKDKLIQFVRFSDSKIIRHSIELNENKIGETTAYWTQTIVSLNSDGNKYIDSLSENEFEIEIKTLEKMLNHYIKTNKCLDVAGL